MEIITKICTICRENKNIDCFQKDKSRKVGYQYVCKKCRKNQQKYRYNNNINGCTDKQKEYHQKNKEKRNLYGKEWRKKNVIPIKTTEEYKKRILSIRKNNYIKKLLRNRIKDALRYVYKSGNTMKLVGCDIEFLKQHLQQTATKNGYMNFDINNYSGKEYHIDHIVPCDAFNLACSYHQKICFNWKNLQILEANENLIKSNSLVA